MLKMKAILPGRNISFDLMVVWGLTIKSYNDCTQSQIIIIIIRLILVIITTINIY